MKLAYRAVDKAGKISTATIEAASTEEANEKLRQQGLFVTEIAVDTGDTADEMPVSRGAKQLKELALWSRQLCVLVRSGTPVAAALVAIERQTSEGPWRTVLTTLRNQVEEGASLSEAMGRHPEHFDDVCRSLVAGGESSGRLGEMLDRLAMLIRQQLKVRRTLVGSLVYPALLLFVGFAVTTVMLVFVLPRFEELFGSLNAPLPPTTTFLMGVSEIVRAYWWGIGLAAIALGVGAKVALSGPAGRRFVDAAAVRLPYIGAMVRSVATARISRLLGVMLEGRVPLLEALKLTRCSTGNVLYTDLMGEAVEAATRGEEISTVFARSPLINPSVSEAIRHGEANGQIGPILKDMADFLDEENEVIVRTAMSVLEPLILIGLGLVVGFIALSLFIPLFDLTSMAGT
jgi:type II secretory pathway component PulF